MALVYLFFILTVTQRHTWTRPCAFVFCRKFCWLVVFWGGWVFWFFFFFYSTKTWNLAELEILESSQVELFCCVLLLLLPQWRCQGRNMGSAFKVGTESLLLCLSVVPKPQVRVTLNLIWLRTHIASLFLPISALLCWVPVTLWPWVNSKARIHSALCSGHSSNSWWIQDSLVYVAGLSSAVTPVFFPWMSPEISLGTECTVRKPQACCEWMDLALGETN